GALGTPEHPRILLDLSVEALLEARRRLAHGDGQPIVPTEYVRGNGRTLPFLPGSFGQVVLLGNAVGFAGSGAEELLASVARSLAPGGSVLLEFVAGPGERSNYLHRLPPGALRRLLAAPPRAVLPRVVREGFRAFEPARKGSGAFRRFSIDAQGSLLQRVGWRVEERIAVAPSLGQDPGQLQAIWSDPRAWENFLQVEEAVGRGPDRWPGAAALLVAARADRSI
ncbi:MAG: class I SAM-dependent methyltransferase, partial [Thermoplasmata archaeon]